jgi:hypothetical protein
MSRNRVFCMLGLVASSVALGLALTGRWWRAGDAESAPIELRTTPVVIDLSQEGLVCPAVGEP